MNQDNEKLNNRRSFEEILVEQEHERVDQEERPHAHHNQHQQNHPRKEAHPDKNATAPRNKQKEKTSSKKNPAQEQRRSSSESSSVKNHQNVSKAGRPAVKHPAEKISRAAEKPAHSNHKTEPRKPRQLVPISEELGFLRTLMAKAGRKFRWVTRRTRHVIRATKAHSYPESNRMLVQFVLFLWGMTPMVGSKLREITTHHHRLRVHRSRQAAHFRERHLRRHPIVYMGATLIISAIVLFNFFFVRGTTVFYNGKEMATLQKKAEVDNAKKYVERLATLALGQDYSFDESLFKYETGLTLRKKVGGETALRTALEDVLNVEEDMAMTAYCLYVNGVRLGATPYRGALEELLVQLQKAEMDDETISASFAEEVEIKEEYVAKSQVVNLGYIAELLYSTKEEEVTYEVKRGDSWSKIAESNGMTSKELLALNPGYDVNKIQIGEQLTISASVPYLTLTVTKQEHYVNQMAFDVEYTDSADLYTGDYKVTSKGEYGLADEVASVTYVNGTEAERTVLSSVTLKNPVTEQRLRGTKERPTWHPTGKFRWPCTGVLTSRFGGRKSPGGIGSTNHQGIDIGVPKNSPIYAADGGTVTHSGWMGGYGYLVIIDHGNGYQTYYGHNTSNVVNVGDHVFKGQQIAKAGSTGNSTGNHCHFGIKVNGVFQNPLNYLP